MHLVPRALILRPFCVYQVSEISEATAIKSQGGPSGRMWWTLPALLCDIVFLSWIYMSLVTMMKLLKEQNETYKLEMYSKLSSTIVFFVTLFGILTVIVLASRIGYVGTCLAHPPRSPFKQPNSTRPPLQLPHPRLSPLHFCRFIEWPWNLLWVETVSWEVLNFAVLAAICWIWRPSPSSKYLSQAKQLPTSDDREDGIEFSIGSQFSITDDDDLAENDGRYT